MTLKLMRKSVINADFCTLDKSFYRKGRTPDCCHALSSSFYHVFFSHVVSLQALSDFNK